eukprot:CAMPEP_0202980422 /NCGR_PEP_ID=MMETSP1396-20130829/86355_1 /ASSEMBLY_ACC=CAM_ASM_000872 /TAXON_ID= /ORGANISM="Pseudokeronopsis sp., Strain Brazil" /LENGTH=110 /DNA_ID=CAMNT_0049720397 /DNA_START=560 /DNA_END=892 /DNA_ORIENTATION=-
MDKEDKEFLSMLKKSRQSGKEYAKEKNQSKIDDGFEVGLVKKPMKIIDLRSDEKGEQIADFYRINKTKELNPPALKEEAKGLQTGDREWDLLVLKKENLKHELQTVIHKK